MHSAVRDYNDLRQTPGKSILDQFVRPAAGEGVERSHRGSIVGCCEDCTLDWETFKSLFFWPLGTLKWRGGGGSPATGPVFWHPLPWVQGLLEGGEGKCSQLMEAVLGNWAIGVIRIPSWTQRQGQEIQGGTNGWYRTAAPGQPWMESGVWVASTKVNA